MRLPTLPSLRCFALGGVMLLALLSLRASAQAAAALADAFLPSFTAYYFGDANCARSLALGDMNGDGALDIVQGNVYPQSMVYLSDGNSNFDIGQTFGGANGTNSIAVGDMNGDGTLDIVQGNGGQPSVVYLNDGTGRFGSGASLAITYTTMSVALGDVNGDGALDIVQGNNGQPSLVYLNDGTGGFGPGALLAITTTTMSLALGDVNGDGALDIVQGNGGQPSLVYLNNGAGRFGEGIPIGSANYVMSLALGDLNGDGMLDIVLGNYWQASEVYFNDGTGHFSAGGPVGNANPALSIQLGDMNGDGALDIVQGNYNTRLSAVYLNDGTGHFGADILFGSAYQTYSVALGDVNGDGALDIAQGNNCQQSALYLSNGVGGFGAGQAFGSAHPTTSITLGDMNGDGAPDIVQGNRNQPSRIYQNDGVGHFSADQAFGSAYSTTSLALGDLNGDGALDIAQGNDGEPSRIYLNDGGGHFDAGQAFGSAYPTYSIALGDVNGDGALDIAQGNRGQPSRVYLNDGAGHFDEGAPFGEANSSYSVALGDVNGDGALDVAQGNSFQPSVVYLNDGAGRFDAGQAFGGANNTLSLVLADLNGDGALDVALSNYSQQSQVYLNDGAGHIVTQIPLGGVSWTGGFAAGDVNGDGALDIVQGSSNQPTMVYLNDGTGHFSVSVTVGSASSPRSLVLGDVNGDGAPDVVQGNQDQPSLVYFNAQFRSHRLPGLAFVPPVNPLLNANFVYTDPTRRTSTVPITYTVSEVEGNPINLLRASYSLDGGGKWYPAAAAGGTLTTRLTPRRYFVSSYVTPTLTISDTSTVTPTLTLTPTSPLTTTDVNVWVTISHTQAADLRLVLQSPSGITVTLLNTGTLAGPLTQTLRFDDAALTAIVSATAPYSGTFRPAAPLAAANGLNAYGAWQLRVEDKVANGSTGVLKAWGVQVQNSAGTYVYYWDVFGSGFFGQSDNVAFRLQAYPGPISATVDVTGTYRYTNTTPFYQYSFVSTVAYPFRVRGTQVRVISNTVPMSNAIVYRLPAGQTLGASLITDAASNAFHTDGQGYLQGRGWLGVGDKLVALLPITGTGAYTLYYTSAAPTPTGLSMDTVTGGGVQTLTVSSANPLLLFNLDVSLEWDARQDTQYLEQLQFNLRRASEVLYDASNGQTAIGNVTIYHNRDHWDTAMVRVYANNRLRPFASIGGIVITPTVDPVTTSGVITYTPGQVSIGATWNRYGDAGVSVGEDWPRTLAHELSHYLLFQDDDYLGLDVNGQLTPVSTCSGTIMADPYRDDFSEFKPTASWLPGCADTLANKATSRSDWATVKQFYPALNAPGATNTGPSSLPLAVTQIHFIEPVTPTTTLPDPRFYIKDSGGGSLQPGASARAFLFRPDGLVDLGRPVIDQLLARGTMPGDRVCVFEPDAERLGCKSIVSNDDQQLTLATVAGWQPEIVARPVNSQTVTINGTLPGVNVGVQVIASLYERDGGAPTVITMTTAGGGIINGMFNLAEPTLEGYVDVRVAADARETVLEYSLGGNPANRRSGFANRRSGFANRRSGFAPVLSGDGQVIVYRQNLNFPPNEFYTLQTATHLPGVPAWATVVGRGYWLTKSAGAPALSGASVSMSYPQNEVPAGQESFIRVNYWDGATWTALTTTVSAEDNSAFAPIAGEGLYALFTSIEIPLSGPGWDIFPYQLPVSQTVTQALQSINGAYTTLYWYNPDDVADHWKMYDVNVPTYTVDLSRLEYLESYWILLNRDVVIRFGGQASGGANAPSTFAQPNRPTDFQMPPATFYGAVLTGPGFTPSAGQTVTAWVNGIQCGQGQTLNVAGQTVYSVNVSADGQGALGCGTTGASVAFRVSGVPMSPALWSNNRPVAHSLSLAPFELYLPLIQR